MWASRGEPVAPRSSVTLARRIARTEVARWTCTRRRAGAAVRPRAAGRSSPAPNRLTRLRSQCLRPGGSGRCPADGAAHQQREPLLLSLNAHLSASAENTTFFEKTWLDFTERCHFSAC